MCIRIVVCGAFNVNWQSFEGQLIQTSDNVTILHSSGVMYVCIFFYNWPLYKNQSNTIDYNCYNLLENQS